MFGYTDPDAIKKKVREHLTQPDPYNVALEGTKYFLAVVSSELSPCFPEHATQRRIALQDYDNATNIQHQTKCILGIELTVEFGRKYC